MKKLLTLLLFTLGTQLFSQPVYNWNIVTGAEYYKIEHDVDGNNIFNTDLLLIPNRKVQFSVDTFVCGTYSITPSTVSSWNNKLSGTYTPTLSITGSSLTAGGNTIVLPTSSDSQTLSINSNSLSISGGNTINLPVYTTSVIGSTGISVSSGSVITNTAPNQTVTLNSVSGTTITGAYPNYTVGLTNVVTAGTGGIVTINAQGRITSYKRQETYRGTTNASGLYTVTYATSYSTVPTVVPSFITTDPRDVAMVTSSTTTGFTIQVQRRVDVVGLLPTYSNRSGVTVDVNVNEQ